MPVILNLLDNQNLSLKKVSEISGVPFSTLNNAAKKPIENWSIRVLNAFAMGLGETPAKLLDFLQPNNYQLVINDDKQTIQNVYIPNQNIYYNIRAVVEAEHLEGWNPTKQDIQYLLDQANHPDPDLMREYQSLFGDNHD